MSEQEKSNDGDNNNNNTNTNGSLKKGRWSKEEDEILVDYVEKHGIKNWNAIHKKAVLNRDGKSCRLRWLNHLEPGVKKGKFSEHEVNEIIRMRGLEFTWCQMAKQLPGRSDNDIKNFWNSRTRKNQNPKLSGSNSKRVDDSQKDKCNISKVKFKKQNLHKKSPSNYDEMNENNYSKQLPKLVDDSNKQLPKFQKLVDDSKMLYNNVGSTSISHHTTAPTWPDRASIGSSFHEPRVPNLSTFQPYLDFQNNNRLPSIEHPFHRKYPSRSGEINENNSKQLPNYLFDVPNKVLPKSVDDSNRLYKNVGSASTSNHTIPAWTWPNRAVIGNSYVYLDRVPNQNMNYSHPSLEHSLYGKYPSIYDEINKNNSQQLSNSFQVPNKELPKLVDNSNMFYNNEGSISTSNHTTQTWTNRGGNGTSSMQFTMGPNRLPPCSYIQNMDCPQNPFPPPKEAQYQILQDSDASRVGSSKVNLVDEKGNKPIFYENDFGANCLSNFTDPYLHLDSKLLDIDDNNNLNDKLPHDVNDTLDAAINEKAIDWNILSDIVSLDHDDNNNLHDKLPHDVKDTSDAAINGKDIDYDHLPDQSSSYNDDNNNLDDKIPHNIKDTLDPVIYGKSFHPN